MCLGYIDAREVVWSINLGIMGILIILSEIRVQRWLNGFAFLRTYTGRGMFYLFIASVNATNQIEGLDKAFSAILWSTVAGLGVVNLTAGCCIPAARVNDRVQTERMNSKEDNPSSRHAYADGAEYDI